MSIGHGDDVGFYVTPASQSAPTGTPTGAYTITLLGDPFPVDQTFLLSDGGAGGTFSPGASVILPAHQVTTTFTYQNASAGNDTLGVAPSGGPLAAYGPQTVQAVISNGGVTPTGFTLTPLSNRAARGIATPNYYLSLVGSGGAPAQAGVGGQSFTLTDNGGGTFAPGATVTIPQGQTGVAFTYSSLNIGTWTLIASAVGSPFSTNVQTAQAVIFAGGMNMGVIINAAGVEWTEGYIWATQSTPDDVPFAKFQSLDIKDQLGLKKLMGPEGLTAQAVGASERNLMLDLADMTVSLDKWYRVRGGSAPTATTPITNPVSGPTLTAGAGSTTFTAGYIGVAFAYRNKYGSTLISPVVTVSVSSGQQIAVTALGALPSGVTSVDWYVTSQSYTTAPLAAAATLYYLTNNAGTAFNITTYGLTTSATIPTVTSLGLTRRIYQIGSSDQPSTFKLHLMNPRDGSGREMFFYGCVCSEFDQALKLRDFTSEKFSFEVFGDPTTSPNILAEILAP